jgi:putative flippase GtrA
MGPKTAMSLLYLSGTALTFIFNKRWSFHYDGTGRAVLARYVGAYAIGYLANFGLLLILVDDAQWPHRPVQAGLTLVVAGLVFLLQKYWVFVQPQPRSSGQAP